MDAFTSHTGTALPLRRSNVDTDQIIPAVYLKRVTKTGFEDGLFAAWRKDPNFVLNQPQYAGATILVPGPDFGTGSSREHAVWALQNYGFRVVIGARFMSVTGRLQAESGVVHVVAERLEDLTPMMRVLSRRGGTVESVARADEVKRPQTFASMARGQGAALGAKIGFPLADDSRGKADTRLEPPLALPLPLAVGDVRRAMPKGRNFQ